jgi:outer membrane lipoprotein-sorting protein
MTRSKVGSLVLALPLGLVPGVAHAAELPQVLARFDQVQNSIHTLSAEFKETTTNPLLVEPIHAEGRFYMTKPTAIRWEYTRPEVMRFVIADDEYTGYFPAQKRAERRNIQRWREHIFRFFGVGQASDELSKFYDIRLETASNAIPGTDLLVLQPKRKRVRKKVEEAYFWLDDKTFLPRQIEYHGSDGRSRKIEFANVKINPDLAAGLYRVDIPQGVVVTTGFSGLPSFDPDQASDPN